MIAWLRLCLLVVLLAGVPPTRSATGTADKTLTLTLGAGSTFRLERSFDTILIDNPDVVDVRTLSDRAVLLEPLNLGSSNVLFVDERNIAIANIKVVVSDARTERSDHAQPVYASRPVPLLSKHAT